MVLGFFILLVLVSGRRSTFMFYFIFCSSLQVTYISDLLIQSLFSFFTLTTRDHLCSYERPPVPNSFQRIFLPVFRAVLILLSRVSPAYFFSSFQQNFLVCVCQYFFFADVFKSDIWTEFLGSIPVHLLPLASVVRLCVLTQEVSRDGEDGLRSTIFATCRSTLSSSRFTCIVVLMYPTVLLRYSMSCLALIGRRIWPLYRRYLITFWFPL